jgi:hypothetical protein
MSRTSRTQDEWIALRCQSGEPSGFEDLVAVMERPLLYYASKLAGNVEAGLDILQDVWVKVFRDIRGLSRGALHQPEQGGHFERSEASPSPGARAPSVDSSRRSPDAVNQDRLESSEFLA